VERRLERTAQNSVFFHVHCRRTSRPPPQLPIHCHWWTPMFWVLRHKMSCARGEASHQIAENTNTSSAHSTSIRYRTPPQHTSIHLQHSF
jgi:hypothetical protein